jgi:hypothetical protein
MRPSLKSWRFGLTALVLSLLTTGCGSGNNQEGPTGEVEGTVTLNGEPLAGGGISFYDAETGNSVGGAIVNGTFKFSESVPAGEYLVAVQPPPPPQPDDQASGELASVVDVIPDGYKDGSTSGLVATVVEGPNSLDFKLSEDGPSQASGDEVTP